MGGNIESGKVVRTVRPIFTKCGKGGSGLQWQIVQARRFLRVHGRAAASVLKGPWQWATGADIRVAWLAGFQHEAVESYEWKHHLIC